VALCQGAALHFIDKTNGIKDFDIYTFFAADGGRKFPERRRGIHDFGASRFGRHPEDQGFAGRRVDIMGRSIAYKPSETPVQAVRTYLGQKPTGTAGYLAKKAVIAIDPNTVQLGRFPECRTALIKRFAHDCRAPNGAN